MNTAVKLDRSNLPWLAFHTLGSLRYQPEIGIVHLGVGNFHRAHQALYTEEAMLAAGGDWGSCGVTLLDEPAMRDALAPQDNLYSVLQRDATGERVVIVQALQEILVLSQQREQLMARFANPATRIVSVTVTEKGYCYDPATGGLDKAHALVQHDLAHPDIPQSLPGLIVAALKLRRANPFTVMSCDNLAHNGKVLRQVVVDFAAELDPELGAWIASSVKFPSTMVDRIAPATTEADRAAAARVLGTPDTWPVPCESFRQWVIEDSFAMGRPAWEAAGATLVEDVIPYELAKLRMLNGTHSTLAYLSLLAGYATVDEAIAQPALRLFIRNMMTDEIAPNLSVPESFDRLAYRDQLLARYANPALKHRTAQIAMDGSLKLPPRLLGTIAERLAQGLPINRHALAVAAWMRCWCGTADNGQAIEMSDPMAAHLQRIAAGSGGNAPRLMAGLLSVSAIFPSGLAQNIPFQVAVQNALLDLQRGVRAALKRLA